ncbi:MAG: tRNA 2-thiouridine(34) synthase MnmA [Candidatus Aminicenantes bacterium]
MKKKRVVAAMSGGVDSSVAAALLLERGYDVVGVTMNLFSLPKEYCRDKTVKSCCGWGAAEDAQHVAVKLGISHYVVDMREEFEKMVISNFCAEYERGRTPNPCIRCNESIKFDDLMKRADKLNADYIATGHHAHIVYDPEKKRYLLKKGKDRDKDQSYFLYTLTQRQLARTLMPIGPFTKKDIRKKAENLGLPVAQSPESQEICFVPDNDYSRFLEEKIPQAFRPGPIVDMRGKLLGHHKGIIHFTVGQRRGMGIAASHPLYVLKIDAESNTVVAGPDQLLYRREFVASRLNIISQPALDKTVRVKAKIRYKHKEAEAVLKQDGKDRVRVLFIKPQRAITPGQAVVFYDGETVVGGGIID